VPQRRSSPSSRASDSGSDEGRANAFIDWLSKLKAEIGIPARLRDYRSARPVTASDIEALTAIAIADTCHHTNPRPCTRDDFRNIFSGVL